MPTDGSDYHKARAGDWPAADSEPTRASLCPPGMSAFRLRPLKMRGSEFAVGSAQTAREFLSQFFNTRLAPSARLSGQIFYGRGREAHRSGFARASRGPLRRWHRPTRCRRRPRLMSPLVVGVVIHRFVHFVGTLRRRLRTPVLARQRCRPRLTRRFVVGLFMFRRFVVGIVRLRHLLVDIALFDVFFFGPRALPLLPAGDGRPVSLPSSDVWQAADSSWAAARSGAGSLRRRSSLPIVRPSAAPRGLASRCIDRRCRLRP